MCDQRGLVQEMSNVIATQATLEVVGVSVRIEF